MTKYSHISEKDKIVRSNNFILILLRRQSYKFYHVGWYCFLALFGGLVLCLRDGLGVIDGIFQAAAAAAGAGLSTVSTLELSIPSFVILAILMLVANNVFMILPVIIYRQHRFNQLNKDIAKAREKGYIKPFKELSEDEKQIIRDSEMEDHALRILTYISLSYFLICLAVGILVTLAALYTAQNQYELEQRGYSRFANAIYLAISAYANCGYTLTSDNMMGLDNNPFAYIWLTFLILLGNTALPIALRWYIRALLDLSVYMSERKDRCSKMLIGAVKAKPAYSSKCEEDVEVGGGSSEIPDADHSAQLAVTVRDYANQQNDAHSDNDSELPESEAVSPHSYQQTLQYILDNPRKLTTTLFSHEQTVILGVTLVFLILLQYVCFLASTLDRRQALENHTQVQLVGLGYFQALSTRCAGFSILDLRDLDQGLLVVYAIMMYISAIPFVASVKYTNENNRLPEHSELFDPVEEPLQDGDADLAGDELKPLLTRSSSAPPQTPDLKNIDEAKNMDSDATYGDDQPQEVIRSLSAANLLLINKINAAAAARTRGDASRRLHMAVYGDLESATSSEEERAEAESEVATPTTPKHSAQDGVTASGKSAHLDKTPLSSSAVVVRRNSNSSPLRRTTSAPQLLETRIISPRRRRTSAVGSVGSFTTRHSVELTIREVFNQTRDSHKAGATAGSATTPDHEDGPPMSEMLKELFVYFFVNHQFLLLLSIMVCSFSEDQLISSKKFDCNVWYITFEIISAYGSSGLSLGMPGYSHSLSGLFTALGKLVIVFVMILAKHRGLPEANDEVIDFQFAAYRTATGYEESMLYTTAAEIAAEEKKRGSGASKVRGGGGESEVELMTRVCTTEEV